MDEFGTMQDWEDLLAALHQRDMKLIMDLVVNHTSDEHKWFVESRKAQDNPYRDYYIWRPGQDGKPPNNWRSHFSGSAWKYDQQTDEYYLHLFSEKQPDLNWKNPQVREEVYEMMTWWLEKGIDGFRMDVINMISKVEGLPDGEPEGADGYASGAPYFLNGPRVHEYLQEMNQEVLSNYDIMTVGETPGVDPQEALDYVGQDRDELDMFFQFELMDIDSGPGGKWDVVDWNLTEFKEIMSKWQTELQGQGWNSLYLNNHDQPRPVSRFGDDQKYRVESAKMLATMNHTLQGTPYIYQGEEIGMTNVAFDSIADYEDIETLNMYQEKVVEGDQDHKQVMKAIHAKSRDNARTPMQWDDTEHAGFTTGEPWLKVNPNYEEINVQNALADQDSIFYYYQQLIELRAEYPVFVYGNYSLLLADDEEIYAYLRELDDTKLLIILNFSAQQSEFKLPEEIEFTTQELLISNYEVTKGSIEEIKLNPYEARVYKIKVLSSRLMI